MFQPLGNFGHSTEFGIGSYTSDRWKKGRIVHMLKHKVCMRMLMKVLSGIKTCFKKAVF